jgi:hypothetical protein
MGHIKQLIQPQMLCKHTYQSKLGGGRGIVEGNSTHMQIVFQNIVCETNKSSCKEKK